MSPSPRLRHASNARMGFSLVELLIVIVIISILTAMLVPAVTQALASQRLTIATSSLAAQLALARQTAIATHTPIEVHIYQLPDEMGRMNFQAMRLFKRDNFTNVGIPYAPLSRLPVGIVAVNQANYSSLLTDTVQTNQETVPGLGSTKFSYRVICFLPSGRADLAVSGASNNQPWTVTLADSRFATNGQPSNFSTMMLDPLTGRAQLYRP